MNRDMNRDMSRIQQIGQEFAALNTRAGERFEATVARLNDRLAPDQLEAWAELAISIATSGWHAWESSNLLCDIAPAMLDAQGPTGLLACGRYGFGLCGYSFEPGATYFTGIGQLLDNARFDRASPIESAGESLHKQFSRASSIMTHYFRTAFELALCNDTASLEDWTCIVTDMAGLGRAELTDFLAASREAGSMDWSFIRELGRVSVGVSLDYMRAGQLRHDMGLLGEAGLQRSVLKYAAGESSLADWLAGTSVTMAALAKKERLLVLGLFDALPRLELAESLLQAVGRLPLDRPGVVRQWLAGVDAYLPINIGAACGYLSMESARSIDAMERLLGQVNLVDYQRVLQLYAEAMVGRRLVVEPHNEHLEQFRGLPTTDGMSVYLPASISRYPGAADNFALYKVSLLHQLGYYEFGTFDFTMGKSVTAFRDYFRTFDDAHLAAEIFQIAEDARIDWALEQHYRGAAEFLVRFKRDALAALPVANLESVYSVFMDALLRLSLDATQLDIAAPFATGVGELGRHLARLRHTAADVYLTMQVVSDCYRIISSRRLESTSRDIPQQNDAGEPEMPATVEFRGRLEPDRARLNLQLMTLEEQLADFSESDEDTLSLSFETDPKKVTITQLKQGDVQEALGMMITDLEGLEADKDELDEDQRAALEEFRGKLAGQVSPAAEAAFRYDEWDCVIEDYRRHWCTLYEIRDLDEHPEYVDATLKELPDVARNVRRQLNNLKPELLRKVKGVADGEDLDLERAVELLVDKRAGFMPEERIYIERLRKDRDVSTLFLLDMSASTDDRIPEQPSQAAEKQAWDEDDFLHDYYGAKAETDERKRIIDLEKEAVILMAEALEGLGDAYAVCGFSGYGKDQVDYYVCKDFEEPWNLRAKGRIGGIKPCRSTRMGPAIRHGTRRLVATDSRIKAMIIISDGYPQDFDYGKDRNSKDYGIKDTTMALSEARQKGVQTFCLTVDPSGHDYLREMCPDQRYMVIQDINQLPDELSKVYRSLTG